MTENTGLSIGDNAHFSGGVVVGGQDAHAHVVQYQGNQELSKDLQECTLQLLEVLRTSVAEGRIPAEILETGKVLQDQIAAEKPNKHAILSLLAGLASGAGSVQSIVSAVGALQALVAKLF